MRHALSLALALTLAPAAFLAVAADDPTPTGDLAKLQGKWTTKVGPDRDIPVVFDIKGKKVVIDGEFNGQAFSLEGELKLDEKATPNKTIDWTKFTGPNGDDIPDNKGIYRIEGDKVTICSGGPGNDRPTEFKAGDEGGPTLSTLTKVKEEKKDDKPKDAPKDLPKASLSR